MRRTILLLNLLRSQKKNFGREKGPEALVVGAGKGADEQDAVMPLKAMHLRCPVGSLKMAGGSIEGEQMGSASSSGGHQ